MAGLLDGYACAEKVEREKQEKRELLAQLPLPLSSLSTVIDCSSPLLQTMPPSSNAPKRCRRRRYDGARDMDYCYPGKAKVASLVAESA